MLSHNIVAGYRLILDLPSHLSSGCQDSFLGQSSQTVKLITLIYLVPRLRIYGTVPLFPPVCLH